MLWSSKYSRGQPHYNNILAKLLNIALKGIFNLWPSLWADGYEELLIIGAK